MDDKQSRLDSLRRVAQRLRQIQGDAFSASMADRLDAEIARIREGGDASGPSEPASRWDWSRSDYVAADQR